MVRGAFFFSSFLKNMIGNSVTPCEKSISALEQAMNQDKEIVLAAQKKAKTNEPTPDDIFSVGTVGQIIQLLGCPTARSRCW